MKFKIKLLLCCAKTKPYLYYNWTTDTYKTTNSLKDLRGDYGGSRVCSGADRLCAYQDNGQILTNGHIMVECDFEVEEIKNKLTNNNSHLELFTTQLSEEELFNKSCLNRYEMFKYLKNNSIKRAPNGYAINIKNLHIFDEPRELSEYYSIPKKMNTFDGYDYISASLDKAPKHMMRVCDEKERQYILISIHPQEMCRILNEEQTTIIKKVVLKEMLK